MRINKASKSDLFDSYAQTLSSYLDKKDSNKAGFTKEASFTTLVKFIESGEDILRHIGKKGAKAFEGVTNIKLNPGADVTKFLDDAADVANSHGAAVKEIFDEDAISGLFGSAENVDKFHELLILQSKGAGDLEEGHPALQRLLDLNQELASENIMIPRYQEQYLRLLKSPPEDGIKITWKQVNETPGGGKAKPTEVTESTTEAISDVGTAVKNLDADDVVDAAGAVRHVESLGNITEQLVALEKRILDLAESGDLVRANELAEQIAEIRRLQAEEFAKGRASIEKLMKENKITRQKFDELDKLYKTQAKKAAGSTEGFVAKLAKYGAGLTALGALKKVAYVLGAVAISYGIYSYVYGEDEGEDDGVHTRDPDPGRDVVTIDPAEVDAEKAFINDDYDKIQEILSDPAITDKQLKYFANKYNKERAYKLPQPFEGMNYVFMTDKAGGLDIDDPALQSANLDILIEALNNRKTGLPIYMSLEGSMPSKQHALNEAAEEILEKGLYRKRRSRRYDLGKGTSGRRGISGFSDKNLSREQREMKRKERRRASDNSDRFEKISQLKEFSLNSTNNHLNNDTNLLKKADDVSKSYVKDAVKDLANEDKTLREYFTGLGRLYDAESENRNRDYEELYKLHDETGRDLTLSAHPKAIRVSDAMGNGGLVENGLEQKEKLEDVALSAPTGNFTSRYAKLKNLLIKSSKT